MSAGQVTACALLIGALWAATGCAGGRPASAPKTAMTRQQVQQYLKACPKGRLVRTIEADLGLPAPTETEAPALVSESPYWRYKYFHGDMVIMFLADGDRGEGGDMSGFVYAGGAEVCSAADYWKGIRKKQPRPDPGN